jgi:hypothetical protein
LAVLSALGCAAVELTRTGSATEAAEAALAGAIAAGVVVLALTLPGLTWRGALIGGVFVASGVLSWTLMDRRIWLVTGAGAVLFAVWSYPWVRDLRLLPRLGTFWLGIAYWVFGVVGALAALRLGIAAERLAYCGVAVLAVLAVIAGVRKRGDLTVGIAAAFLLGIAVLLLAGSGNVFDEINPVPPGPWGINMEHRFWGGGPLLYHPNSLALIAVVAAVRIGPDRAFAAWQRAGTVGIAGLIVFLTESRTAFGVALLAGLVHGYAALRGLIAYPDRRRLWTAIALPFVVVALVLVASGGQGFLYKARYGGDDLTSGRTETWSQVFSEWGGASVGDKLLGDTKTARAVVHRDGNDLPTDNSAVGALRRGGVLGVLAFVAGLVLLAWRALPSLRRGEGQGAPWFGILVVSFLPAIAVTDWFLGGVGGTLWIMLVAAEVPVLLAARTLAARAAAR